MRNRGDRRGDERRVLIPSHRRFHLSPREPAGVFQLIAVNRDRRIIGEGMAADHQR